MKLVSSSFLRGEKRLGNSFEGVEDDEPKKKELGPALRAEKEQKKSRRRNSEVPGEDK